MYKIIKTLVPVMMILTLAACGQEDSDSGSDETIEVSTTVFPLKSFTEQIGGDSVNVETIYPNGVDIHTYEPTQQEMIEFAEGDLFIYTTDEFDAVADSINEAVGEHTEFLPAAANISQTEFTEHDHDHDDEAHDHSHGSADPHVWLDPVFAQSMAEEIKNKLIELNPEEEAVYEENHETLAAELKEIDAGLEEVTEDTDRDSVYISHESIGYLADRYHFEQVAINGLNNEEPSQQDLITIVDNIESENIEYILTEQNVSSRVTDTIQDSTDTEPLLFHNLAVLTDQDDSDATYQSIMSENISVLDQALNDR